jgi:hypothetical protein
VRFELSDAQVLESLERGLAQEPSGAPASRADDGSLSVRDPDGQRLEFASG